jgi:hypothetical protein
MTVILRRFTPELVTEAILNNLYESFRALQRVPFVDFDQHNDITRWCTRLPYPWYNGVLSGDLTPGLEDQMIKDSLAFFKSRYEGIITWWLKPYTEPKPIHDLLLANGFHPTDGEPGMAVELGRFEKTQPLTGVRVMVVNDLQTLRTWTNIFVRGYGLPLAVEETLTSFFPAWDWNCLFVTIWHFRMANPFRPPHSFSPRAWQESTTWRRCPKGADAASVQQ